MPPPQPLPRPGGAALPSLLHGLIFEASVVWMTR